MFVAGFSCDTRCLVEALPWDSALEREAESRRKELERLLDEIEEFEQ